MPALLRYILAVMDNKQAIENFWSARRIKYNIGLVIAGFSAFVCYAFVGGLLHIRDFEITLFTMIFQGIGYLVMMLVANVCYSLGAAYDQATNKQGDLATSQWFYNLGFWFSFALPFSIPILLVILSLTGNLAEPSITVE